MVTNIVGGQQMICFLFLLSLGGGSVFGGSQPASPSDGKLLKTFDRNITLQPTSSTQQPTSSAQQPTSSTQQPTSSTQQPTSSAQQPTSSAQQPPNSTQQPTSSTQQPTQSAKQPTQQPNAAADKYLLVLDAGSTGTRINVMHFRPDPSHSAGLRLVRLDYESVRPGLSAYRHFPQRVAGNLAPLLAFASERVPAEAPPPQAVLAATAGLRSLQRSDQLRLLKAAKRALSDAAGKGGRLGSVSARVLTGTEEALYGWLAVNFLMNSLGRHGNTYGLLDMGGGSTQIVFQPEWPAMSDEFVANFRTLGGRVFVLHQHSYQTLGMSKVTLDLLGHSEDSGDGHFVTPCLAANFSANFSFGAITVVVQGDSQVDDAERYDLCSQQHEHRLQAARVHRLPVPISERFVAVSSFYYSANTYYSRWPSAAQPVPANLSVAYLISAARTACASPVSTGRYAPYACIGLVHISNLLSKGYGFPPEQRLFVTDKIDGHSANWPLGLAVHWLTGDGRGRGGGGDGGSGRSGSSDVGVLKDNAAFGEEDDIGASSFEVAGDEGRDEGSRRSQQVPAATAGQPLPSSGVLRLRGSNVLTLLMSLVSVPLALRLRCFV